MTRRYSATAQPTTLANSCTNIATTIVVAATTGFPATDFVLALDYGGASQELVLVTGVAGTTLSVTRGYDGTTPASHTSGVAVRHVHSAADFADSRTHEAATSAVHGLTGTVVGTSDVQILSNKDLSSGTNTFPAFLTATKTNLKTLVTAGANITINSLVGTKVGADIAHIHGDINATGAIAALAFVVSAGMPAGTTGFVPSLTGQVGTITDINVGTSGAVWVDTGGNIVTGMALINGHNYTFNISYRVSA